MSVIDFVPYSKCRDEVKELDKTIESLKSRNAELNSKLDSLYSAYQTLQYSCEGRVGIYSSDIESLRQKVETLKSELRRRYCEESEIQVAKA